MQTSFLTQQNEASIRRFILGMVEADDAAKKRLVEEAVAQAKTVGTTNQNPP